MVKIFISGISGKMGRAVIDCAAAFKNVEIAGGFDAVKHADFPTFSDPQRVNVPFDVIIDFSRPETLGSLAVLCKKFKRPVVLATTGYGADALIKIDALSKEVPVFISGNMSVGINVALGLVSRAAQSLWGAWDAEITETHHNQKVEAPSGTAKMFADAISAAANDKAEFIYGRSGSNAKRGKNEVGVHSLRGGTVVGEHEISFFGNDEIITIKHVALSRKIFADGALKAALFLADKPAGKYGMKELVGDF
jgi:4-hydroxy-tetrahydrodipicolinate reductase